MRSLKSFKPRKVEKAEDNDEHRCRPWLLPAVLLVMVVDTGGCSQSSDNAKDSAVVAGDGAVSTDSGVSLDAQPNGGGTVESGLRVDSDDAQPDDGGGVDSSDSHDAQPDQGVANDSSCPPWQFIFPKIGTATLRALWGSASDDVYAAGSGGMLHYDGNKWAKLSIGIQDDLYDVWGNDKNNIYAVNNTTVGSAVTHFDGQSWKSVLTSTSFWKSVWGNGPQDVFAANADDFVHFDGSTWKSSAQDMPGHSGLYVFGCNNREVFAVDRNDLSLYRFDGSIWSRYSTQPFAYSYFSTQIDPVWCASANDIWLISSTSENNGIAHWNGRTWNALETEAPETAGYHFTNMFETPDGKRFLCGQDGALLRFDGDMWRPIATGTRDTINSVWGVNGDELFLAGDHGTLLKITKDGVEDFNEGLGSSLVSLLDLGSDGFAGVSRRADLLFGDAQQTRFEKYAGPANFNGVSALGTRADDILIGGYYCLDASSEESLHYGSYPSSTYCATGLPSPALVHYDGTHFTPVDLGASFRRFRDFDGTGDGEPVYVDNFGKVGSLQNGAFIDYPQQPSIPALYVAKNAAGDVYAVSSSNRVRTPYPSWYDFLKSNTVALYRFENQSWSEVASVAMSDVAVDLVLGGDGLLYLIGRRGTVYQYNAGAFRLVADKLPEELFQYRTVVPVRSNSSRTTFNFSTVVKAANDIYIAPGTLHYNGFQWQLINGNGEAGVSVFTLDTGDIYVEIQSPPGLPPVSARTFSLSRYQRGIWSTVSLPEAIGDQSRISGVWGSSPEDYYVSEARGQIWHYNGSDWSLGPDLAGKPIMFGGSGGTDRRVASYFGDVLRQSQAGWQVERESAFCDEIIDIQRVKEDVFALCSNGDVLRKEGKGWLSVAPESSCAQLENGIGVSVSRMWAYGPSNIFISGRTYSAWISKDFTCHYDGERWNVTLQDYFEMEAIWGEKNDAYAIVGGRYVPVTTNLCEVSLEHYDGTAWTFLACEHDMDSLSTAIQGTVSGPVGGSFVSSAFFLNQRAHYYNGSRWTSFTLLDKDVYRWIGDPTKEIYASTYQGAIYYKKCQ